MNTSLHTLGWTDPAALDPENGVQLFAVGWLSVIPAPPVVDDVFEEVRSRQRFNRRILRDDDEIVFATIVAFMEIRDRWH